MKISKRDQEAFNALVREVENYAPRPRVDLEQFSNRIRGMRALGWSVRRIAEQIKVYGVSVSHGTVDSFCKKRGF